ncbi:hypothetical protein F2Q69_00044994 [Brassica cretica]|uniref:PH domain-containing protein n=1 Tax=Brassica cretica TaxID=69181 RepID=A0A8S9NNG1_BRACR|nr:hypothetical protein F2Q69_00044994 [Brassica cretica]
MAASLAAMQRPQGGASNTVYKSGPLFISSKGLGWTSWKKRWFILTRNSLVFFKNDPSVSPQKGGEVNLTLGGIDLNSSGSVVVREDKKLLTVLFPDGRDGRAFTLKAESLEDLYEWKAALEQALAQAPNAALVYKSGPLFISSKGLGWTSWKKRWFILTRNSLVFFKNDPSVSPQKGGEVNLTLGGIDLNSSGSVVVREDKKLLTVLFPDGRDGRAFTLKAESLEDLYEWKAALEQALAQAPNAALVIGQNGIFRTEANNIIEGSFNSWRDQRPLKSSVVGRPILLALEEIDGSPSFLEKALQFLETYGTKVEGILRQSADVEEVERRVYDYEQGNTDFSPEEDPHVVGDCVKNVNLEYRRLIGAKTQVVAGTMHHLTVEVADGETKKVYEAKVLEKAWENLKKLEDFTHLRDV